MLILNIISSIPSLRDIYFTYYQRNWNNSLLLEND